MNFDESFEQLLSPKFEGGYSNDLRDSGGETMYGITKAVARANGYTGDMRTMPKEVAKLIYRTQYWNPCQCDRLPPLLRYPVFDAAVNSGPGQATKWLQRALGIKDDGVLGNVTLAAANAVNSETTYRRFLGHRLTFMTDIKTWDAFGKGWARRIATLLTEA